MFSDLVIAYLFLGGTGAGVCLLSCALGLMSPASQFAVLDARDRLVVGAPFAYCKLFAPMHIMGVVVMGVGMLCLFFDLGRSERVLAMLTSGVTTIANIGALALGVDIIISMLGIAVWTDNRGRVPVALMRIVQGAGVAASLVVMAYTGFLLSSMEGVALWRGPFLPLLFTVSSASCACALVLLLSYAMRMRALFAGVWRGMVRFDAGLIAVELLLVAAYVVCGMAGTFGSDLPDAMHVLVGGDFALAFWAAFVALGLAVPFAAELALSLKHLPRAVVPFMSMAACTCVLIGGAVLRYLVATAAAHPYLGAWSAAGFTGLS